MLSLGGELDELVFSAHKGLRPKKERFSRPRVFGRKARTLGLAQ